MNGETKADVIRKKKRGHLVTISPLKKLGVFSPWRRARRKQHMLKAASYGSDIGMGVK